MLRRKISGRLRLSDAEARTVVQLEHMLATVDVEQPGWPGFLEALHQELQVDLTNVYSLGSRTGRLQIESCQLIGAPVPVAAVRALWNRTLGELPTRRHGLYDPERPEEPQRNVLHEPGRFHDVARGLVNWRKLGITPEAREQFLRATEATRHLFRLVDGEHLHQLRVLVCDGPSLLAWFGVLQERPFTARQRRIVEALIPAVHQRLRLDRALDDAKVATAGLAAALEQLGAAAFVVDGRGSVVHANSAARVTLEEAGATTELAALRARDGVQITRIAAPGLGEHHLVIARRPADELATRVESAALRHRLTPRQTQVLTQLALGRANKVIAAHLGCAENTVELHVTLLLRKLDVGSRAEAVARLWGQGPPS